MSLPKWLQIAFQFAPLVLGVIPATAPIAAAVSDGIAAAQMIEGATGAQKKAYVMQIAADAVSSANAKGATLNVADTLAATSQGIDTAVSVINAVKAAHDATTPVQPVPNLPAA